MPTDTLSIGKRIIMHAPLHVRSKRKRIAVIIIYGGHLLFLWNEEFLLIDV